MKKSLKIVLKIILVIIAILTILLFINFVVHKIKSNDEYKELNKLGYINKYSAGDYNLNIYRVGNKNSKHKIIALSGLGVNDYSIEMSFVNDNLKEDYEIIYIDRAGYGYSDDTSKRQTVEQVVSDYRTALKNAGINGPYVLLPHSFGGVYATYWENVYQDEIEGIIFVDSSEIGLNIWDEKEYSIGITDYLELFACKFGLQRLVLDNYYFPLPSNYSKDEQKIANYLNIHSSITKASMSEIREINNNTNKSYDSIKSNNIPKIYISANTGFRTIDELKEYISWANNRMKELGKEEKEVPNDKVLEKVLEEYSKWRDERIKPYIESLGNTKLVPLPGDHMIFEQKPEELTIIIKDFITNLD